MPCLINLWRGDSIIEDLKNLLRRIRLGFVLFSNGFYLKNGQDGDVYVYKSGEKTVVRVDDADFPEIYYNPRALMEMYDFCSHPRPGFVFNKKGYRYFGHVYNSTFNNERAIEIPIFADIVEGYDPKDILEIGNVLSHYFPSTHMVVDKYEKAEGVTNQDIADFKSSKKFDLIVSISTLEHVGWDETPKEPEKALLAFRNIERMLAPDGVAVISIPLGHNPYLDRLLHDKKIRFKSRYYMKRISEDNLWIECGYEDVEDIRYDFPYKCANGLFIGIIKREGKDRDDSGG